MNFLLQFSTFFHLRQAECDTRCDPSHQYGGDDVTPSHQSGGDNVTPSYQSDGDDVNPSHQSGSDDVAPSHQSGDDDVTLPTSEAMMSPTHISPGGDDVTPAHQSGGDDVTPAHQSGGDACCCLGERGIFIQQQQLKFIIKRLQYK